ncbi:MAG: OstA-like protein, partial [Porphyromonas endodontalis]
HIESTRGVYDTEQDLGILLDRSIVYNTHGTVEGDSLLYDNRLKFAEAFGNMVLIDTVNQAILRGEYGYYDENKEYAFSTQHAWLTDYSKPDTLYLGADTLELITRKQEPKDIRITRAYHNTRVYRNDAQAVADSLHYFSMDSTMALYGAPILWRDSMQLEGDTIRLHFADDTLHHATAWLNAKAMRLLEDDKFEQIKGDSLIAFFADSSIREMQAHGEVEMVYYALQESIKHYYAVGRIKSPHVYTYLAADTLQKTIWQGPASGGIHPIESVSPDISRISGLVWQPEKRPKSPDDLFTQELDSLGAPIPYTHPHASTLRGFSGAQAALAAYQLLDKEVEKLETQQAALEQKESQGDGNDKDKAEQEEKLSLYIRRPDDSTPSWLAPQPLDIFNNAMKQLWDSFSSSTINEQDASNTSQSIGIKSEKP